MCRLTLLFAIAFLIATNTPGQGGTTFSGKLEERLVVDTAHVYQRVWSSAVDTAKLKFSPVAAKGSVISTGELIDQRAASGKSPVLLVEPPSGVPYIWFDSNENGIFEGFRKGSHEHPA